METAYGSKTARPPAGDLVHFLAWTIAMRHLAPLVPPSRRRGRYRPA